MKYLKDEENIDIEKKDIIFLITYSVKYVTTVHSKYPDNSYLINFEQTSAQDHRNNLDLYPKTLKILDYSLKNMSYYHRHNYYYLPYMVNPKEILELDKTEDFIIIGTPLKRRTDIVNALKATNFLGFGKERDDRLFMHKILVNIHAYEDYVVLEELRVNRCIYNKMIVITEKSGSLDYYDLKDHIIECDYKDIVKVAKEVLENYEYYYNKLFKDFDLIRHSINRKAIADAVINNKKNDSIEFTN